MSYRNTSLIVLATIGACSLYTACEYQMPTEISTGGAGIGGSASASGTGGDGSAGSAGGGAGSSSTSTGGSAGAGGGTPETWWNTAWTQRVRISFLNEGSASLKGFPVMVRLDASRFQPSLASPTGADLRFIDNNGTTILQHEIDGWKPDGDSFVWVRVPTIDPSNDDFIWLYYGNPAANDTQNPPAVWNSYVGVYHLSPSTGASTHFADSAGSNPGTWFNGQAGGIVEGLISQAIQLDGTRFVEIGDNDDVAAHKDQARTAEAWISTSQLREQAIVWEEGQCVGWYLGTNANGAYFGSFTTDPELPLCMQTPTSDYTVTGSESDEAWHYLALVVDRPGLEMHLFVDGELIESVDINNHEIADGNGRFHIGSDHDGEMGTFAGIIDEVRVSRNARSPAWIAAQYKSMTDTFLSFGP